MGEFEVAFTAKGFAMFVEALTGRVIAAQESTPAIEPVVKPEAIVVKQETPVVEHDEEQEDPEVNELVQQYMSKHIIPTRKKYERRGRNSKNLDKECAEVYKYVTTIGEPVQLSAISKHMISLGFKWETKRATVKMRTVIGHYPQIKNVSYGLYGVVDEEAVEEVTVDV